MTIIYFIAGAHKCLINEISHTKTSLVYRSLRCQHNYTSELVEYNEDFCIIVVKIEICNSKRTIEALPLAQGPFLKQF